MIIKSVSPKFNILMQNRPKNVWIGGDMVQLESTKDALVRYGHNVEFSDSAYDAIDADIVHLFNFSMSWTHQQFLNAKQQGKKVVCSMIYHETDKFVSWVDQQNMADGSDALIFQTKGEIERAKKHLKIDDTKTWIIPNGIDPWWFEPVQTVKKNIVLTVGRIEPFKNQLTLARACNDVGVQCVCVGEVSDAAYTNQVLAEGALIIPPMGREGLKKLYAVCRVFAIVSQNETWSLVADEAGSQSANIVMTDGCEREDIPGVFKCSPNNQLQIRFAIQSALKESPNISFREKLKDNTWDKVAKQIERVYENISSC